MSTPHYAYSEVIDAEAWQPMAEYDAEMGQPEIEMDMGPLLWPAQNTALGVLGDARFKFKKLKFSKVSLTSIKGYFIFEISNNSMLPLLGGKVENGRAYFNGKRVLKYSSSSFTLGPNGKKDVRINFDLNARDFLSAARNMVSDKRVRFKTTGDIKSMGAKVSYKYDKTWRW